MEAKLSTLAILASLAWPLSAAAQPSDVEQEIKSALVALPDDLKAGATVVGYGPDGRYRELRAGNNGLICLTDNPANEAFTISCHHESMHPLQVRRRELQLENEEASRSEIFGMLEAELDEGKIAVPRAAAGYYLRGPADCYDADADRVCEEAERVYLVFAPMQTGASLGFPGEEREDVPWIMFPGRILAHVMIEVP